MTQFFDRAEGALAWIAASRPHVPMLFIALFAFVMFLPGFFTVPPIDRDETRFAQASRQMVETGDYIDIRLGEGTRYKKPIGIYWLQAATLKAFGEQFANQIWVYRLPSLVAAVAACLLTYLVALSLVNAQAAFLAALLMAVCLVLNGEARLAKTDATLLVTVLLAQLPLARLHMEEVLSRRSALLFWIALGLSALTKGPIGPMVVGLTILALCVLRRDLRWLAQLRPLAGLIVFALIVVPWFIAITQKSGNAFWDEALGRDLLSKIGQGQESHGAPPGAFSIAIWLTFWPASIFLPFGIAFAWIARREAAVLFCLAWILPSWLVFELTATKLIHYVLPTFPAIAILCAAGWLDRGPGRPGRAYTVFLIAFLALAFVFAAIPAGFAAKLGQMPSWPWYFGLALSLIGIWFTWSCLRAGDRLAPALGFGVLCLGLTASVFANLARLEPLWPSVALFNMARGAELCDNPVLISVGYQEESLMLLTDRLPVFLHDSDSAIAQVKQVECAVVFVDAPFRAAFEEGMVGRPFQHLGRFVGFSIGGADEVDIVGYGFR